MSQHAIRYIDLLGRIRPDQCQSTDYQAPLYLLSSNTSLYDAAKRYVDNEGIDFRAIKRMHLHSPEELRHVIDIAHNLFSYDSPCEATPFEISRLGYANIEHAYNAILIASGNVNVLVNENPKGIPTLVLDDTPLQKSKELNTFFHSFQENEMER